MADVLKKPKKTSFEETVKLGRAFTCLSEKQDARPKLTCHRLTGPLSKVSLSAAGYYVCCRSHFHAEPSLIHTTD